MTVGEKLGRFHDSFINGYDHELFDDLWHEAYEGFSNSMGTAVNKANLRLLWRLPKEW